MNFTLPNIDGKTIKLDDYQDAPAVIVVFSCNHCPYVIAYEERIKQLHDKYEPQGVPLIAISANDPVAYPQDSPENMKVRARDKDFKFPYLFDETQEVAQKFGAERTPHVFVIKYEGGAWKTYYKGAIDDNWEKPDAVTQKYVEDQVDSLLRNGDVAYKETPAVGCTIKWKV